MTLKEAEKRYNQNHEPRNTPAIASAKFTNHINYKAMIIIKGSLKDKYPALPKTELVIAGELVG